MMRNMATSLFLTVREKEDRLLRTKTIDQDGVEIEVTREADGQIRTTLQKAKEVRALVEKCITIAVRSRAAMKRAADLLPPEFADFNSSDKEKLTQRRIWRQTAEGNQWAEARAPVVAAQRRVMQLLGNKRKLKRLPTLSDAKKNSRKLRQRGRTASFSGSQTNERHAVHVLFYILANRFAERPGGYTRILRLAKPRLGDAGTQAILEIITPTPDDSSADRHQRVRATTEKPAFDDAVTDEVAADDAVATDDTAVEDAAATDEVAADDAVASDDTAVEDAAATDDEAAAVEDDQADDKKDAE